MSRVLLTGSSTAAESFADCGLSAFDRETSYIPHPLDEMVLTGVADGEYDGVVCQADGAEALEMVSRIRMRNPRVPIVLVSARPDGEFEKRARNVGASEVVTGNLHAAVIAENVTRLMRLKLTTLDLQELGKQNDRLRRELLDAMLERKSIPRHGHGLHRPGSRQGLLPLLVENHSDQALQMVKAFEKAGLYAPLPIMKSADDALSYLQGAPPFENRAVYPLPNAILLDLDPSSLGVDLCRWLRRQTSLAAIPVIVLSDVAQPASVIHSFGSSANSFLVKSGNFDELVSLIRSIDLYWTRMNVGRAY